MRAMRAHLGRRVPADGRRQHALERGRRHPRRPRAARRSIRSGSRSRPSPTTCPATRASCARAACPSRRARTSTRSTSSAQLIAAGGVTFPEPDVTNCGGVTVVHEGLPPRRGVQPAGHLARRPRRHRAPAGARRRTAPTSKPTASASTASSPSRSASKTGSPSRLIAPATALSSTGRDWRSCARNRRPPAGRGWGQGVSHHDTLFRLLAGGVPNPGGPASVLPSAGNG